MIGEKLLIKLWETIADKGIGGLLAPWQTLRTEKARTQARAEEIVLLAEAERQAKAIKAGKAKLVRSDRKISVVESDTPNIIPSIDAQDKHSNLIEYAEAQDKADSIRRNINLTKAVIHAENLLSQDGSEPTKEDVDEDWIYRWKEYSAKVSTEDLQQLWGAVLAGEVKEPGTYNLRTLEFLKNISKSEAELIEKCAIHHVSNGIPNDETDILENQGLNFSSFLKLQQLGILQGVDSVGLQVSYDSIEKDKFKRGLISNDLALLVTHEDPNKKLTLNAYGVTELGKQILSLGKFKANRTYLKKIGKRLVQQGFKVHIGTWRQFKGNHGEIIGVKEIKDESV